ncbi:MAG: hypothetical protein IIA49_03890, partial [Bacteroidetes bacterium]|nr:hypothetical protein [Bacteroidota bacterium]
MFDIIKEILNSPAGSFGSVLGVFLTLTFLIYKAGRIVEKFELVKKLEKSIDMIKEDIAQIKGFISALGQKSSDFIKSKSPITLSKAGSKVSNELKIKKIIETNWEEVNKRIKQNLVNEVNPYNIQQICFAIGKKYSEFTSESELDYIKIYAFNAGKDLYDFDILFGIEIRDAYFKK